MTNQRHSFDKKGLTPGCAPDGHRWEYVGFTDGAMHYICLECAEQMFDYVENHGC